MVVRYALRYLTQKQKKWSHCYRLNTFDTILLVKTNAEEIIFHFMIQTKLKVKGQIHFFELVFTGKIHDNIGNTCTTKHVADKKNW